MVRVKGEQIDEAAVSLLSVIEWAYEPWVLDERWSEMVGRRVWRNLTSGETAIQNLPDVAASS